MQKLRMWMRESCEFFAAKRVSVEGRRWQREQQARLLSSELARRQFQHFVAEHSKVDKIYKNAGIMHYERPSVYGSKSAEIAYNIAFEELMRPENRLSIELRLAIVAPAFVYLAPYRRKRAAEFAEKLLEPLGLTETLGMTRQHGTRGLVAAIKQRVLAAETA